MARNLQEALTDFVFTSFGFATLVALGAVIRRQGEQEIGVSLLVGILGGAAASLSKQFSKETLTPLSINELSALLHLERPLNSEEMMKVRLAGFHYATQQLFTTTLFTMPLGGTDTEQLGLLLNGLVGALALMASIEIALRCFNACKTPPVAPINQGSRLGGTIQQLPGLSLPTGQLKHHKQNS